MNQRKTKAEIAAQVTAAHARLDEIEAKGKPFSMVQFCRETSPNQNPNWIYNTFSRPVILLRCRAADLQMKLGKPKTAEQRKSQRRIEAQIKEVHRRLDAIEAKGKPFTIKELCMETSPHRSRTWLYHSHHQIVVEALARARALKNRFSESSP